MIRKSVSKSCEEVMQEDRNLSLPIFRCLQMVTQNMWQWLPWKRQPKQSDRVHTAEKEVEPADEKSKEIHESIVTPPGNSWDEWEKPWSRVRWRRGMVIPTSFQMWTFLSQEPNPQNPVTWFYSQVVRWGEREFRLFKESSSSKYMDQEQRIKEREKKKQSQDLPKR